MRVVFFLLCLLMYGGSVVAQIPNDDLAEYTRARENIVVLNNSNEYLPLGRLDTLRLGLLSVGLADDSDLLNTLNAYVPTARGSMTREGIIWEDAYFQQDEINFVIMVMDAASEEALGFPWHTFLLSPDAPMIMVMLGKSPLTDAITADFLPTFIYGQEDNPWTQSLIAQLIFGGVGSNSRLANDLNSNIPQGSGVSIKANNRLAFAPPATQAMNTVLLQDSIAAIVNDGLANGAFPGAQVLVAKNGVVVYHEAFGYHTEQQDRPVQLTDIYDLASVTKISSALAALMKWQGEGNFDLDATLVDYYPPAQGSNKADLVFRDMLSHQARLRPWIPYWQATLRGNGKYPWSKRRDPERINDYRFKYKTLSRDSSVRYPFYLGDDLWQHRDYRQQMMKAILKSPLNDKAEYRYSGLLFYLLPEIVTTHTGVDYETYLNETFYQPLGAYTLGYNPLWHFPLERIIPTERDSFFRMRLLHGYVHDEGAAMMGGVSANAGLFANAIDLAKMMQMYLNKGSYGGQEFIRSGAVETFTQRYFDDLDNRRGLGFDKPLLTYNAQQSSVAEAASDASFGHAGYTGTFTWMDPENELLFIFLSNRVYPSRNNRGIYIRNIRPRIHTVLYESME